MHRDQAFVSVRDVAESTSQNPTPLDMTRSGYETMNHTGSDIPPTHVSDNDTGDHRIQPSPTAAARESSQQPNLIPPVDLIDLTDSDVTNSKVEPRMTSLDIVPIQDPIEIIDSPKPPEVQSSELGNTIHVEEQIVLSPPNASSTLNKHETEVSPVPNCIIVDDNTKSSSVECNTTQPGEEKTGETLDSNNNEVTDVTQIIDEDGILTGMNTAQLENNEARMSPVTTVVRKDRGAMYG